MIAAEGKSIACSHFNFSYFSCLEKMFIVFSEVLTFCLMLRRSTYCLQQSVSVIVWGAITAWNNLLQQKLMVSVNEASTRWSITHRHTHQNSIFVSCRIETRFCSVSQKIQHAWIHFLQLYVSFRLKLHKLLAVLGYWVLVCCLNLLHINYFYWPALECFY